MDAEKSYNNWNNIKQRVSMRTRDSKFFVKTRQVVWMNLGSSNVHNYKRA